MSDPDPLELRRVSKHFGSFTAVDDVSLTVRSGARHAIIGPNGAGKSTLFGLISGTLSTTTGTVLLDGRDATRLPVHRRVGLGTAATFQHSSLFMRETVLENVLLAVLLRTGAGLGGWRRVSAASAELARARTLLEQVGLPDRHDLTVGRRCSRDRKSVV